LPKKKVVHILKQIRKERYRLYKQIATLVVDYLLRIKGTISQQAIKQFIQPF
jgi:hypothetical protein